MGRPIRTLGCDPGFLHTWMALWEGKNFIWCGHVPTPRTIAGILSPAFWAQISTLFKKLDLQRGDELVIERFTHRGRGGKGSMAEILHALIDTVVWIAIKRGMKRFLVTAGAHKVSYTKHHPHVYPRAMIEAKSIKYGKWHPRLKTVEPCLHLSDSMTLACHQIALREGLIVSRPPSKAKGPRKRRRRVRKARSRRR